jgi:hypothetical protein
MFKYYLDELRLQRDTVICNESGRLLEVCCSDCGTISVNYEGCSESNFRECVTLVRITSAWTSKRTLDIEQILCFST